MKWYNSKSFFCCFENIIYFLNYRLSNVIHLQRSLLLQNLLCVSGLTSSDRIPVSMFFLLITVLPLYFLLIRKRWYEALSCVHFLWLKSIGVLTVILPSDRVSACLLILVFPKIEIEMVWITYTIIFLSARVYTILVTYILH